MSKHKDPLIYTHLPLNEYAEAELVAAGVGQDGRFVVILACSCGREPPCWQNSFILSAEDARLLRDDVDRLYAAVQAANN